MVDNHYVKVKRNDEAVWRVIDGDIVVLLPQGAMLHALKGCGKRVWELIEGEITIPEIVRGICNEYDVEPQRASADITEFVYKLATWKLVDLVQTAS